MGSAGRKSSDPRDPKTPVLDVRLVATPERARDAGDATRLCTGECVLLELTITGGTLPYAVTWSDSALSGLGPHRVCPAADTTYEVRASDTPRDDDEFTRPQAEGSARIELSVKPCDDPPPPATCERLPSRSLYPSNKWWWQGGSVFTTPIVANLTDDNGDSVIDARDVPNVVIVANLPDGPTTVAHGALLVLDGPGSYEFFRDDTAWTESTPAVADLDGDRRPEIVMVQAFDPATFPDPGSNHRRLAALQTSGDGRFTTRFSSRFATATNLQHGPLAIAIADLDHDGSPEIIAGLEVFDANGDLRWVAGGGSGDERENNAPAAVDLDGDGFLEVITGSEAYRHDGSLLFANDEVLEASDDLRGNAFTAVADLDADGAPEIVVATTGALFVLDAAGQTLHRRELTNAFGRPFVPSIGPVGPNSTPAILISDGSALHLLRGDLTPVWSVPTSAPACCGAAVAFDFLGDGWPEVVFGDDRRLQVLDGLDGHVLFETTRREGLRFDYPVIADIDDDGSADLIMTHGAVAANVASVQVWSEAVGWAGARRIMNQHTYHVTNVSEDGAIPQHAEPHWKSTNSFRTQLGEGIEPRCDDPVSVAQ